MADPARRAFLRGALLDPEARAAERRRQRPLGPGLPWIAGQVTAAVCRDCAGPCETACPSAIVRRHAPEHALAGVPWLNFRAGGCTFCGACAQACPQPIDVDGGRLPVLGAVALDTARCLAWNGVICMSCLRHCRPGALRRGEQMRIQLDAAACIGCGACVAPCPQGALAVPD